MPPRSIHPADRHATPRRHTIALRRLTLLAILLAPLAGCAMPTASAHLSPAVASLPETPGHVYRADTPTMKRMIARTVNEMHWAVASLTDEVTAAAFEVWTPADQQVLIRSRQLDVNRSAVQVRVGRFGNPDAQARFHDELARQLELYRAEQVTP